MKHRTPAIAAGILLCLLLLLMLAHAVAARITGRKVQELLDRFAADGRPMTAAEVIPPPVPDDENGARLYLGAAQHLKEIPCDETNLLHWLGAAIGQARGRGLPEDERRRLEEWMDSPEVAQAIEKVRQAVMLPACRFDNDWNRGMAMVMPHLIPMRNLVLLVDEHSRRQAAAGDRAGAWESAWLALRAADALRGEPTLVSQLTRAHLAGFALERIAALAADGPPEAALAARLDRRLEEMSDREPLLRAMDGERLLFADPVFTGSFADLAKLSDSEISSGRMLLGRLIYSRPVRNVDRAAHLEALLEFSRQLKLPYARVPKDIFDRWELPRAALLTRVILPSLGSARHRYEHFIAQVCVTRTGLALERHRAAHGEYPAALAALDPQLLSPAPDDTFTGAPLIYRRTAEGFLLYSAGPDGRDDGGKRRPPVSTRHDAYDIPWGSPPKPEAVAESGAAPSE